MDTVLQTPGPKPRRQGTVTHAPTVHDHNVYRIRYSLPTEKNGKQKRVVETVKGTRKDAEKILRKRLASLDNGLYITPPFTCVGRRTISPGLRACPAHDS